RDKQEHNDARKRRRQRHHDDEWIQPGLEVDDDQHIDQQNRENEAANETHVSALHGPKLAPQRDKASSRQLFLMYIDNSVGFAPYSAEVSALDRGVDVDNPSNVVVVDGYRLHRPVNRSNI